jgi:hypothetical protein
VPISGLRCHFLSHVPFGHLHVTEELQSKNFVLSDATMQAGAAFLLRTFLRCSFWVKTHVLLDLASAKLCTVNLLGMVSWSLGVLWHGMAWCVQASRSACLAS